MPPTILSDDEGETCIAVHLVRKYKPTAVSLDSVEPATLSFQKKAVNNFCIAEAAQCTKQLECTEPSSVAGPSQDPTSATSKTATLPTSHVPNQMKRVHADLEEIFENDNNDMEMWESAYINLNIEGQEDVDIDGIPIGVDVQSIVDAFATEGVNEFMGSVMNIDDQDLVSKMEGFAIQGMKGRDHFFKDLLSTDCIY
ncbi:uncharacterized protein EDB93DRAFT_1249936 [Suillus bovinus]|uniref:uncharacterized protein n=1 Tax=Suillus bovinus TaxID=48563 RepID=UPI001B861EF8|nr:uncharacterized protein EDB93DRAFT_1249936 [Suillus bovinus]KAG2148987.1 hypothetical protein EDB93DRAFT_1249936 [Suillus bovinus]